MATEIIPINNTSPSGNDTYLFDTNVWIYLLCPISDYDFNKQKVYSKFFQGIISAKGMIFCTSLILSEFVNRCLRFDYNLWKDKPENAKPDIDFKRDFVGSEDYAKSVQSITTNVKKIESFTEKYPDSFNAVDLNQTLTNLKEIDFNDSYLIELLKMGANMKFVTNDTDFFNPNFEITVITGNV